MMVIHGRNVNLNAKVNIPDVQGDIIYTYDYMTIIYQTYFWYVLKTITYPVVFKGSEHCGIFKICIRVHVTPDCHGDVLSRIFRMPMDGPYGIFCDFKSVA